MSDISPAQLAANRANAQLSTGPTSEAGRHRSSLNATKHGLTGRTVVLFGEDLNEYFSLVQQFTSEHQPVGPTETGLVETIADCQWRLSRGSSLEADVNAMGPQGESGDSDAPNGPLHATLTAAREFRNRPKTFNNLALYLTRIHRMQERALKQLKQIQAERQAREQAQMEEAILMYKYHKMLGEPYDPAEDGFEFSVADIEREIARRERRQKAQMAAKSNFNLPQFRMRVARAEAEGEKGVS